MKKWSVFFFLEKRQKMTSLTVTIKRALHSNVMFSKLRFYGFSFFDLQTFWKLFSSTVSPNRALSRGTVFSRWELLPTPDLTCPINQASELHISLDVPQSWTDLGSCSFVCCVMIFSTIAIDAVKESVLSQKWGLLIKNRMF